MKVLATTRFLRIAAISVALIAIGVFALRTSRYVSRPTFGFETYYSSAVILSLGIPAVVLYDQEQFSRARFQHTGINSNEPFAPNPPLVAVLFLPLTLFSLPTAKVVWECFSFLSLLGFFMMMEREMKPDSVESLVLVAFAFGFTPLYMNFVYGQFYVVLLLLLGAAYRTWRSGRRIALSILLAILLFVKGFGLFLLLMLFFLKDWTALALTAGICLVGVMVSGLLMGFDAWGSFGLAAWQSVSADTSFPFQQNLAGVAGMIAGTESEPSWLSQAVPGLLLAGAAGLLYGISRRVHQSTMQLLFGIAIILGVISSPVVSDYHYTLLLLPLVLLYETFRSGFSKRESIMLTIALFLVSVRFPVFPESGRHMVAGFLAFPRVYGSVLLVILLWQRLRQERMSSLRVFRFNDQVSQ